MSEPLVSVVIPTRNGFKTLKKVLPAVFNQKLSSSFEVIIVDSESSDGTVDFAKQFGVRFLSIGKRDFNHGATRQWAAEQAKGEFVVFLTQDATPAGENWLKSLLDAFECAEQVVGAYSRQIPYPDCHLMDVERILQWFGPDRKIYYLDGINWENLSPMEKRLAANFDDVSSCIRRKFLLKFPFKTVPYGEDLEWAKRVLMGGMRLVYEPSSVVFHSHQRSPLYEFKRRYVDHKVNKAYYGIELFKDWEAVKHGVLGEWKRNDQKKWFLNRRGVIGTAQVLGTFFGARSIRYGEPLKLSRFEKWLTRGV